MGKASRWIRNLLAGKKEKDKNRGRDGEKNASNYYQITSHGNEENPTTPISIPPTTPKEKRRWSFRRSSATATGHKDSNGMDNAATTTQPPPPPPPSRQAVLESEDEQQTKHATAVPTAAVIQLTAASSRGGSLIEEAAAIKIQSAFRACLARKALCALKGLVKLQALVRGHLVREQAAVTLRCMQALLSVQARARAQRITMAAAQDSNPRITTNLRKSTHHNGFSHSSYYYDTEENIKIVEMDLGESKGSTKISRNSYSSNHSQTERTDHRFSTHSAPNCAYSKQDHRQGHNSGLGSPDHCEASPATSVLTAASPRACSGHFQDYALGTAQSSPHYHYSAVSKQPEEYPESLSYHHHDFPFFPNYMANTESSRAKARSQSAPKARPDSLERQLQPSSSRRRPSVEGRNVPRAVVRMQRSSSHVGSAAAAQNYQYPWSIKLDRSTVSIIDSECGSSSTVLTNAHHCRSLVGFDVSGNRH